MTWSSITRALALAAMVVAFLVSLEGAAVRSASKVSAFKRSTGRERPMNPVLPDLMIYQSFDNIDLTACRAACANQTQCDIYMLISETKVCFLHHVL